MLVYILLYNANTEDEGIHTIQEGDLNKILMFQDKDDALRYTMMLEAQDFPKPSVEVIDSEEIKIFCEKASYEWEIVEPGKLAIPPEINLEQTSWEEEEEQSATSMTEATTSEAESDSSMPSNELDKIRNQLEGLL
ncbi:conserved hypothetical protein [Hyella patelloides LEGE 07179]|uniref:DUF3110 domain-containing protein n=1 Tax=Hyella patelloides LEGE 07179 TaxID=945734 RepID=A0A563VJT9_9CYAN|nr:DUF3110 domain-containing protein [Hyella patelloides]VEP11699.1 conserved hypothetical protein [Hyella patelloides LEGE 07179]